MSIELWYTNNDGDLVLASDRVRFATLELSMQAIECAVGESQIVIDDPEGNFYTPGHVPLYVVETEAWGDDFKGIIGVFWTWNRVVRRGPYRAGSGREVVISCKDLNTLLSMRVQKGTDAERDQENDVERMEWLINTAEVIGGHGDFGFTIEETEFFFDDSPVQMSETDYTAQDSSGVINDALQDSSKQAYLYNRATGTQPIRVGIWYGHTDRSDFTSALSISNDLAEVDMNDEIAQSMSAAALLAGNWTFAPSIDAELDRDPSRQITNAMVQWDGGSTYVGMDNPPDTLTRRDMVFSAELVKNEAQAIRRGNSYLNRLQNEDDAITCAVIVPGALVNGFHQGMRVPVRFTHMSPEGYAGDPVNMRIAQRTVRQISQSLYEIALDLRGESQPFGNPSPGAPPSDYDQTIRAWLSNASGPYPLPSGSILWGSHPQLPWDLPIGPFTEILSGVQGADYVGIQIDDDGFLQHVYFNASAIGVALGANEPYTVTFELTINGVAIETFTEDVLVDGASNLYVRYVSLQSDDVAVSNGDILAARVSCTGANGQAMEMFRVPHGIDPGGLSIQGGYFP